jgi:hypothetical protein
MNKFNDAVDSVMLKNTKTVKESASKKNKGEKSVTIDNVKITVSGDQLEELGVLDLKDAWDVADLIPDSKLSDRVRDALSVLDSIRELAE